MKKVFSILLPIVKNKYFLVTFGVLVWVLFFDKNDLLSQLDLTRQVKKLQKEKKYFTDEIRNNKRDLEELKTNPKNLEKFARENYYMKKDDEVIYVIVPDKKPQPQAISANRAGSH
jgi:cell division protein FtsB